MTMAEKAAKAAFVEVYPDGSGQWRWRKKAANGRNVGNGGEGYTRKASAVKAAERENKGVEVRVKDHPEDAAIPAEEALAEPE